MSTPEAAIAAPSDANTLGTSSTPSAVETSATSPAPTQPESTASPATTGKCIRCGESKAAGAFSKVRPTICLECKNRANRQLYQNKADQYRQAARTRMGRIRQTRQQLTDGIKAQLGCARCDEDDPIALTFHHVDAASKVMSIRDLAARNVSEEKLFAEISKCIVLCFNCHAKHHRDERQELAA